MLTHVDKPLAVIEFYGAIVVLPDTQPQCLVAFTLGQPDDGDGDLDLVLGASSSLMNVNEMIGQLLKWETTGGAVVLLENTLK